MIRLQVNFKSPGLGDCEIHIYAKGFLAAMLYWSVESTPLSGWSSIAAVPINTAGKGFFQFRGSRGIPVEATHICARCITPDFTAIEEGAVKIPDSYKISERKSPPVFTASLMSDLHLSRKSGRIVRALDTTDSDTILLAGDLTNDGYTEEFALLRRCIEEKIPVKKVFSVAGNHDKLFGNSSEIREAREGYEEFQDYLLQRGRNQGIGVEIDSSGVYEVRVKNVDILGLQCVDNSRNFVFPDGAQLKWLDKKLERSDRWHIILCHAPLLKHNPHRNTGTPYLGRDEELQKIIDSHRKIIFVSGHTHVSPNIAKGCVECICENQTVYINDGSVTPTELKGECLMPREWKDGVRMELALWENEIEIKTKSIHTEECFPRGYYRFRFYENVN